MFELRYEDLRPTSRRRTARCFRTALAGRAQSAGRGRIDSANGRSNRLAADLFGLTISTGMVCKLEQATSDSLETPVDELRDYVRNQDAGADETSWRENRSKAWLWVAVTQVATVFTIAGTRGAKVIREMLGENYNRVLTSDRWTAYTWIKRRQLCWAHLRRDFQAMIDRENCGSEIGKSLLESSDQLFHWWHRVRDGTLARNRHYRSTLVSLRRGMREQFERGAECSCKKTAGTYRKLLEAGVIPVDLRLGRRDRPGRQRRRACVASCRVVTQEQRRH